MIAAPELFIATAAERTKHIRLGTGVMSLPYHHPLILADRMVLLDHLTHGRMMFGVGPGSLTSDSSMLGIAPVTQRERMEEALEAIVALLTADGPITRVTEWFTLENARLQLRPFTFPHFEIAVAATTSPAGPRTAGRFGTGMISMSATSELGFAVLGDHWKIWTDEAQRYGHAVDRAAWRLMGPMHIAPTREQAFAEVEYGLHEWIEYFRAVPGIKFLPDDVPRSDWTRVLAERGVAIIGTPDDAIAQIERLRRQSGGFGCFIFQAHDWVERVASLRSYELLAEFVFPRFQGSTDRTRASRAWCEERAIDFQADKRSAIAQAMKRYERETGYRTAMAAQYEDPTTEARTY
jgi:limonene 1,2-monooxygenase